VLIAALLAVAVVVSLTVYAVSGTRPGGVPKAGAISPAPRELTQRSDGFELSGTVHIVRDDSVDDSTVDTLTTALKAAGATDVAVGGDGTADGVNVWLAGARPVLDRLKVKSAEELPAEGYVLAVGQDDGRRDIAIDGADARGTFYAVQTLRQLMRRSYVPGVAIRDWPAMGERGVILGFYGTPWSQPEILDQLDLLAAHKLNTFVYSPKDDAYLREKWREPLPGDRLANLRAIVGRAVTDHVDVGWILSPGLSICFSSPEDQQAVLDKLQQAYGAGVRSFGIALDDVDYTTWHCSGDATAFGSGAEGAGKAQAALLNRVAEWARDQGDVARVQLVPTEYFDLADSAYKQVMRAELDKNVVVMFTGNGVVPRTLTVADVTRAKELYGHDILIWDNYPVSDYIPGRMPVAPYTGREPGLSDQTVGILSNPESHPAVNKLTASSVAAFTWHDDGFDPQASWQRAVTELAGGDQAATDAFATFADVSTYDDRLHLQRAPKLAKALEDFWKRWRSNDRKGAVEGLRPQADALVQAPKVIRAKMPAVADQAKAWLDAMTLWGQAMQASLDVLNGDAGAVKRVGELIGKAQEVRDTRMPHNTVAPYIADGVLDEFLAYVTSGYATTRPVATTTSGTYQQNTVERMVDGDLSTFYSTDRPVEAGDAVSVDLGEVRPIGLILLQMGSAASPDDYLHQGVLEISADGTTWFPIPASSGTLVRATAPQGATARYVRYRATADNDPYWVAVREFTVQRLP
jgi:hyaluronoglucosaminidase